MTAQNATCSVIMWVDQVSLYKLMHSKGVVRRFIFERIYHVLHDHPVGTVVYLRKPMMELTFLIAGEHRWI